MSLSRLLYVSRCAFPSEGTERDAAIGELAAGSCARNGQAELTGSLLYVGDSFVQVLEGPTEAVERTFERICCDFRHEDVKLIDLVPIKERIFPEWSMAFLSQADVAVRLRDDLEEIRFLVGVNAREAVAMMRRVLEAADECQPAPVVEVC